MKVLHVTPYFHGAWAYGGIPRLSFHLAAAQAALGHTVHVVTTDVQDRMSRRSAGEYSISGLAVRVYPNLSNALAYHYQFFAPRGLRAEKEMIKRYDLVHLHGHRNLLNTRMAAIAHAASVPAVLMPNGTLVNIERRQVLKTVYDLVFGRRQLDRTAGLVAVAEAEKRQFEGLGLAGKKIRVIPNGVKMETDAPGKSFRETFGLRGEYLLYLGKITPRKGIEHIIAALPLLEQPRTLIVAGNDMGWAAELRRRAAELKVADRVIFTGLITGALKAAVYKEALYTVYVGRDEIFGLVPWESILCGTPVIVAQDCGCGEWIMKAGAGHVVPYADPAAIARVINRREPEADQEMVRRGAEFCRDRLSWRRIAEEMIEYYKEIIEG